MSDRPRITSNDILARIDAAMASHADIVRAALAALSTPPPSLATSQPDRLVEALARALHNQVIGCLWTTDDEYEKCSGYTYHLHDARLLASDGWLRAAREGAPHE